MSPRWWEIDLPDAPGEQATPGDDHVSSITDTRMTSNAPNVIYLTRSGTSNGVKVVKTSDVVYKAEHSCGGSSPGIGEFLSFSTADYRTVLTHLELQAGACSPVAQCSGVFVDKPHQLVNNRCAIYRTANMSGGAMYVLAIASGFPASFDDGGTLQVPGCPWVGHAGQPMLVLVDVTNTGTLTGANKFGQPIVLRVALGSVASPPQPLGHAIAVCTKTIGASTFAFVGDLLGTVWVFDVTGSKLLPAPTGNYLPGTPFLRPISKVDLPKDPVDGFRANCIDIIVVNDFLYCALGRNGIGVINISLPISPALVDVIDTPGLALGISTRSVSTSHGLETQLVVGDSRCGIRVYQ